jgi:hypothetical protein
MQALGHRRPGGGVSTLTEKQEEESQLKKSKEKQLKQEKVLYIMPCLLTSPLRLLW